MFSLRCPPRLRHPWPPLLLLLAIAGAGCGKGGGGRPPELVIRATGSLEGTMEPCGCKDGLGGLARRIGLHDAWRAEHPDVPILTLDAGRAFPMKTSESDVVVPTTRRALDLLGTDVVNLGEEDLEAGLSPYLATVRDGKFKTISANLVSIDGNRPVFSPYVVVQGTVNGQPAGPRVAVIGVAANQYLAVLDGVNGDKVQWLEFHRVLTEYVPKAKAEADLVVVLANFGPGAGRLVANRFPDVDLIVACAKGDDVAGRYDYGGTDLVMVGTRAKYDVLLELARDPKSAAWQVTPVITPLDEKVPENRDALSFTAQFKSNLEDAGRERAALMKKNPSRPDYLGSAACAGCHAAESAVWKESRHAHAWEPMVESHNTMNPLCLHCHSVGFMKPNGYRLASDDRPLQGVGCESCHGPGSRHVTNPTAFPLDKAGPATCTQCHTPGQTPDFDFTTFWPKIKHGTP